MRTTLLACIPPSSSPSIRNSTSTLLTNIHPTFRAGQRITPLAYGKENSVLDGEFGAITLALPVKGSLRFPGGQTAAIAGREAGECGEDAWRMEEE